MRHSLMHMQRVFIWLLALFKLEKAYLNVLRRRRLSKRSAVFAKDG